MKRKIAIILCTALLFTNSGMTFASERVSENETEYTVQENETEESIAEESTGEIETPEEASNDESGGEISVSLDGVTISENEGLLASGFHGMELSSKMIEDKRLVSSVASELDKYESGVDYVEDEVYFEANSRDEAEEVAKCYNAQLTDFQYGIAVIKLSDINSVSDTVKLAAQMNNNLPAVFPNCIREISEETNVDEREIESENANIDERKIDTEKTESIFKSLSENQVQGTVTVPLDPGYASQWQHTFTDSLSAWETTKGSGVVVAVLDTGAKLNHEDLKDNLLTGVDTTDTQSDAEDDNGHGTHVSGIIAAEENGLGGVGIAPEAKILPVKVLTSSGSSTAGSVAMGIRAAIESSYDVNVINMSLGGTFYSPIENACVTEAANNGIVVVCAAGNDSRAQKSYPAAYEDAIAVASITKNNSNYSLSYYSNWGDWVDLAAPGQDIYSTTYDGSYGKKSGTSMACPVTTGVVALMIAADTSLKDGNKASVNKIRRMLVTSTKDGSYSYYGYRTDLGADYAYREVEGGADAGCAVDTVTLSKSGLEAPTIAAGSNATGGDIAAGETQYLSITSANSRANIYYTYNGKNPTAETGFHYTGKLSLTASGKYVFKAVAVVGNVTSKVAVFDCNLIAQAKAVQVNNGETITVVPGKSVELMTEFTPEYTTNQTMEWSTTSSFLTVSPKGIVKCDKTATAGATGDITGKTTDGSDIMVTVKIKVADSMAQKVQSSKKGIVLTLRETTGTETKGIYKTADINSLIITDNLSANFVYSSTKKSVVTVDSQGKVTAVGRGKANIVAKSNDGSNKKVTIKVEVIMPVVGFYGLKSDCGFWEDEYRGVGTYMPLAKGGKIKITPYFYGGTMTPSNKKIIWTSSNSKVKVNNGKVTCAKDAVGTAVITATAADGYGATSTMTYKIYDAPSKIYFSSGSKEASSLNFKFIEGLNFVYKTEIDNARMIQGNNIYEECVYTVDNPDVANFLLDSDYGWILLGTKPGKCKITYKTIDGSNKSCSVNVTVTNNP